MKSCECCTGIVSPDLFREGLFQGRAYRSEWRHAIVLRNSRHQTSFFYCSSTIGRTGALVAVLERANNAMTMWPGLPQSEHMVHTTHGVNQSDTFRMNRTAR